MNLNDGEMFELLKYVNNEGGKGKRLISFQSGMSQSIGDNWWDDFLFGFDNGPTSAAEDPWPDTRIKL